MDKYKIEYIDFKDNSRYIIRVPVNLEWFEICNYINNDEGFYQIIYNHGKFFYSYYNMYDKNNIGKINRYTLSEIEAKEVKERIIISLYKNLEKNEYIVGIINKFEYKCDLVYDFNREFFILESNTCNNIRLDIINQNNNIIGNIYLFENNIEMNVRSEYQLEVLKLLYDYMLKKGIRKKIKIY